MDWHLQQHFRRIKAMSPRRKRNHKLVCYCDGWWFPHRIYSRASDALRESHGTDGCKHYRERKK